MRRLSAACVGLFVLTAYGIAGAAPNPGSLPKTLCGITAGKSVDKDVVRLYGKGLFAPNEDFKGGRYFVDPHRQMTLHATIGVDNIIHRVQCSKGISLPSKSTRSLKQAATARLAVPEFLAGQLRFGASANSILKEFGKPTHNRSFPNVKSLIYTQHSKANPLGHEVQFHFVRDKLVDVYIYSGE